MLWTKTSGTQPVPQFSSVQSFSCVRFIATPWTIARQASLSITNSRSLFKLISIESMMPSNHLILCHPLLLPPLKSLQTINAGEGVETRENSNTVGGNANQYDHYGEQCGDYLRNWKQNCHTTQQSHCWAYTLRKPEGKETHVPQCSSKHCLQQLGHGSNLAVHWQMN